MSLFADRSTAALERALDAASLRHQVTSNNLANVNTPGFKRARVAFEDALRSALSTQAGTGAAARALPGAPLAPVATHPAHFGVPAAVHSVRPQIWRDSATTMRNDGNNVDVETELALLTENSLWYQAMTRQLSGKLGILRQAITEGRR